MSKRLRCISPAAASCSRLVSPVLLVADSTCCLVSQQPLVLHFNSNLLQFPAVTMYCLSLPASCMAWEDLPSWHQRLLQLHELSDTEKGRVNILILANRQPTTTANRRQGVGCTQNRFLLISRLWQLPASGSGWRCLQQVCVGLCRPLQSKTENTENKQGSALGGKARGSTCAPLPPHTCFTHCPTCSQTMHWPTRPQAMCCTAPNQKPQRLR